MRLTNIYRQVNYHRHFKRVWKKESRLQAEKLVIPPALVEMRIPIIDAKEMLPQTKSFEVPITVTRPWLKHPPVVPSVFEEEKCFYIMHYKTKVSESENQTLSLTKTLPYEGLPSNVSALIGKEFLPNQEDLVQTSILQAQVWDADQDKLQKKIDIKRPGYNFRRDYGIRTKKQVSSLLEKLTFLCECASGKYSNCLQRSKLLNCYADLTISRNGEIIGFKLPCDILLTSKEPLKMFSTPSEIKETENVAVPDIYPIKATLDLDKVEELQTSSLPHNFNIGHLHTIFIAQKSYGKWHPKQTLARAIGTCFSFSALKARQLYGENVAILPEPICVQCIYMDIKSFNFITYQLNTLDLDHNEGIKNQVWIEKPLSIYESVSETSMITGYNPDVFPRMLGLYLNGLLSPDM